MDKRELPKLRPSKKFLENKNSFPNNRFINKPYPKDIDYKSLGQKLKAERKKINFTQEQVAEQVHVTPAFIGHIERGERSFSLETLVNICNVLGITIDYVLSDTLPQKENNMMEQIKALLKNLTAEQQASVLDIVSTIIRHI